MDSIGVNDLREEFLSFFESKGHLRHKSYSLVPEGDKSLLLINAGMTPLKKYFTGEETPPCTRMTTCQKCIRTPDIDRVGLTARHGTFFEMLGNFSFGDYFKEEALTWAWEFLTERLHLPRERLWATIFEDDEEAFDIWTRKIGLSAERVVRLGRSENFWEHGAGPCGPCSEIYYDRGEQFGCGKPDCKPGCECDRYMEIWNNVFTQFEGDGKGGYTRLSHPNIDTGMGLERLALALQGVNSLFEVDTVRTILSAVEERAGKRYGEEERGDVSLRVITDHLRSTVFLVSDGVVPSNEGRGYVLRRLLRRAARHGRMLGISEPFLSDIAAVVARENQSEYPELTEKLPYIQKVLSMEEERFAATIDAGLAILNNLMRDSLAAGKATIPGEEVFRLYDTFGFPPDLTREIAAEQSLGIDEEVFAALMRDQKERARAARASVSGWDDAARTAITSYPKTDFVGYDSTRCEANILGILTKETGDMPVERVTEGDFTLITDRTVFYGEGGGQVGDTGLIYDRDSCARVLDTKKKDGVFFHLCTMVNGDLCKGDLVRLEVDEMRRAAIRRNHSACHLLQAALRERLGPHVEQRGSLVDEGHCRFDFTHFAPLTEKEIADVEGLVNAHILLAEEVETIETDIESAKKMGAMMLFGEKYGARVRVVRMGEFSSEFCGGTHVRNTGEVGLFKILSEGSVAAGVRRIEAVSGLGVIGLLHEKEDLLDRTAAELRAASAADLPKKAAALQDELKGLRAQLERAEAKLAGGKLEELLARQEDLSGLHFICGSVEGVTIDAARAFLDNLRARDPASVALIALSGGEKLNFLCSVGAQAVARGLHAGKIVKETAAACGGGGGGRPDSAMAGGKDKTKIPAALETGRAAAASMASE